MKNKILEEKIALFPGSFDPFTLGHIEIVQRGLNFFDKIVIGLGINSTKTTMFSVERREGWIRALFADEPRVRVERFVGLTTAFAHECGARFILRGLRNAPDFEYEKNIDLINKHLAPDVETVYLISSPETGAISSTLVREVIRFGGELKGLAPDLIIADIYQNNKEVNV